MARRSAARRWTGAAIVAVLAVVVAVLAVVAMQRVSGAPAQSPGASSGPAALPTPSDSPEPTRTPSATPTATVPAAVPREAERFLVVAADGVVWRGTAGSCERGIAPVIERSGDGGVAWSDVTPTYRGVTQLLSLDDFADGQAQAVATVLDGGSGDDACDLRAIQTFSDGEFWEDADDALAASTYARPADPATLASPAGDIEAPCAEPRSVRSSDGQLALVCDGRALQRDGGDWVEADVRVALAVAVTDGTLYVAHLAAECDGVQVTSVVPGEPGTAVACVPGIDPSGPLAIDAAGQDVWLWAGDDVQSMPSAGGASEEG